MSAPTTPITYIPAPAPIVYDLRDQNSAQVPPTPRPQGQSGIYHYRGGLKRVDANTHIQDFACYNGPGIVDLGGDMDGPVDETGFLITPAGPTGWKLENGRLEGVVDLLALLNGPNSPPGMTLENMAVFNTIAWVQKPHPHYYTTENGQVPLLVKAGDLS